VPLQAMTVFSSLVADFSPRRPAFAPGAGHVGFVVAKVVLGHDFPQATDDNIIRRMRFACWVTKATDAHSEYIIHIAFPRNNS
jgi:hypothetical protein